MKAIIASTSTIYGKKYLDYLIPELIKLYKGINEILFIPYARPSGMTFDEYTELARKKFHEINISVKGIHEGNNPKEAIKQAKGIFTGGGNTFLLVKTLYENDLMDILKEQLQNNIPYLGTSAGSNITGQSMKTTNDMPIVEVPSYKTLGLLPFNINPHYLDPKPDLLQHMGETRDTRIKEYLHFNSVPVVALREGSWIEVNGNKLLLKGQYPARIYFDLKDIREIESGSSLHSLFS
jgi:dipeptidase E